MPNLTPLPFDTLGDICIGHEVAHVALLGGDIAHELK